MVQIKYLQYFPVISKNIQTVRLVIAKSYCKGRNVKISDSEKLKNPQIESILFKSDEERGVPEREKEAAITSRLSKEYDQLNSNKLLLRLTDGFKLTLDDDQKPNIPPNQPLDETISKLKDAVADLPSDDLPPKEPSIKKLSLTRQEPGPVIWGFVPKEWVTFFYPKTGVCGFYTFLFTTVTYLVSKEIYVLEHNYYSGLSVAVMVWAAVHYIGPPLAKWLDKEIDDYENAWKKSREDRIQGLKEELAHEKYLQYQAEGQLLLVEAKRENVALQYEDEFRKRQMHVYADVKRILNYQVATGDVFRKIQQRNLVQYVEAEVRKSVTPEMQNKLIDGSIEMLVGELSKTIVSVKKEEVMAPVKPPTDGKSDEGGKDDKNKK
ncbi:ATP synthase subunit b, mitochondrial-like [Diorhabda sublineata]|uniref:ATP synthase subunit b, mitochondrial-like n=1 Tax=Diorhabda sublineata TaxID=1163346 RepID=UPI0024E115DB|nr:ATP synthase subunit b, mitochondrial-like [Diorhabda sublineata]